MIERTAENVLVNTEGFQAFMDAYRAAPADADIEIAVTNSEQTEPRWGVLASVGDTRALFTYQQARTMAKCFENMIAAFSQHGLDYAGFPNMVLYLRTAADKCEEQIGAEAAPQPPGRRF